jgi:hypothetical protein
MGPGTLDAYTAGVYSAKGQVILAECLPHRVPGYPPAPVVARQPGEVCIVNCPDLIPESTSRGAYLRGRRPRERELLAAASGRLPGGAY